jgi:hypothetical protein
LNNATLPAVREAWENYMGFREGRDYVIGTRPPKEWGVPRFSTLSNYHVLTTRWGAYAILDGSDNYNKHRGAEFDWVGIDELRDAKPGAMPVYMGRMRGKASKRRKMLQQILGVTSPPTDPEQLRGYAEKPTAMLIEGTTFDNARNLPEGYTEYLGQNYDDLTYRREVLGELIPLAGTLAYYAFTGANVISGDQYPFDPDANTDVAWDFNASTSKPMATLIIQERPVYVEGVGVVIADVVVAEFVRRDQRTQYQAEEIVNWLLYRNFRGRLRVVGDHAGHRKESSATFTDYEEIGYWFGKFAPGQGQKFIHTRPTLSIRDRVAAVNMRLCTREKRRYLFICHHLEHLLRDLRRVQWKENGTQLDDSNPILTHVSDALSYHAYNFHPPDFRPVVISN